MTVQDRKNEDFATTGNLAEAIPVRTMVDYGPVGGMRPAVTSRIPGDEVKGPSAPGGMRMERDWSIGDRWTSDDRWLKERWDIPEDSDPGTVGINGPPGDEGEPGMDAPPGWKPEGPVGNTGHRGPKGLPGEDWGPVHKPDHYNWIPGIECIDVVKHMNFCRGNAVKYIWRAGLKGGPDDELKDLRKAVKCLRMEIEHVEKDMSNG